MREADPDLDRWRAEWRAESPPAKIDLAALRRRVRRRTLGLWVLAAVEMAITAAGGWLVTAVWRASGRLADFLLLLGYAAFCLWVFTFAYRNRRGIWAPAGETSRAFLDLSLERCRRRLRSLRFGWGMLAVEAAGLAAWIAARMTERAFACGLLAALVALMGLVLAGLARRTRRELAELEAVARAVGEEG
jgi:hypothetical protein